MDTTLLTGDTNEIRCLLDLQSRGYYCSLPYSGSCRYDLIMDVNNKLYKVQCKASYYHDGVLVMSTSSVTINTKEVIKHKYTKDEVDFYYTNYKNNGFLIPFEKPTSGISLRLEEPLSGVSVNMNIASDYLIDNVLKSLEANTPLQKYIDNRFISIDSNGIEKLWTQKELEATYTQSQIKTIRKSISKGQMAYDLKWKYKEFPSIR